MINTKNNYVKLELYDNGFLISESSEKSSAFRILSQLDAALSSGKTIANSSQFSIQEISNKIFSGYENKICFIRKWIDSFFQFFIITERGKIQKLYQEIQSKNRTRSYQGPELQVFGKERVGQDGKAAPDLIGIQCFNIATIDGENRLAACFASCFHTTESREEIIEAITRIRTAMDHPLIRGARSNYFQSLANLYNHLVRLHDALPGESTTKKVKIYWNERLENILFPSFFKDETVLVSQLLFAVIPGSAIDSQLQDSTIDFNNQLEFVGMDKDRIFQEQKMELERLFKVIFGRNIIDEVRGKIDDLLSRETNDLMRDAYSFTFQNNLRLFLLNMEVRGEKIGLNTNLDVFLNNTFCTNLPANS